MANYEMPDIPYIEAHYQGKKQRPTAIILAPSFTTSEKGAALGIAMNWHSKNSPHESGHFTVDEVERYRTTNEKLIAGHWHCSQKGAIRITICAEPYSAGTFWHDDVHRPVLSKAAELVAELSLAHRINVDYFTPQSFEKWKKRPSRSRGSLLVQTPEGWPWQRFYNDVMAQRALKTPI